MIETLALAGAERIDRQAAERWFDLRATADKAWLLRMGAELCLVISGAVLMARLRKEHPDWKWKRSAVEPFATAGKPRGRGLPAAPWSRSPEGCGEMLRRNLDQICVTELPATIELLPSKVITRRQNKEHLLQQLVQLAKTLDNDYEALQRRVEPAPLRRPAGLETAATLANLRAAVAE